MDEVKELIKKAEELSKKEQYKEIIDLLHDVLLDKYNSADLYARRARSHNILKETEKAFVYVNKAIDVDPDNYIGYFQRGLAWYNEEEYDKAIIDYSKTIELKKNNAFAYNNRGIAWYLKGEYDKAIADYNKAIELKRNYAIAYNNRGISWNNKEEYDRAISDYNKAIELKKNDAQVYNNRGNAWKNKGEYIKAINDYDKAIELKEDYALVFRNKGDAFYGKGDLLKALENYQKAVELDKTFDFLEYKIKIIKEKLRERKILEESKAQQKDKDKKIRIEEEIEIIINAIREAAKSEVKTVVHYTKVLVAEIYIKHLSEKRHYSNAIYMNDPMEGKVFFQYLNDKTIEEAYVNGERRTETSVYLGSFLPAEENDGKISHEDELVMWRTYGKDENGREATGCSIVLNSDFFKVRTSNKSETVASIISDTSQELLNVVYIKNQKKITNDSKGQIKNALSDLKEQLRRLIKLRNKYKLKDDFYKDIENTIFKQLSTITYLFKSADYDFEHEVRVITYMPRDSDSIKFRTVVEPYKPCKRFYIESYNDILPYIKKIYLGPKVENYQQWSLYFDYEIRQRAKELEGMSPSPYQIKPSEIEIMKSECKFQ
ncbi:MAG TPA: tetratricopeptide repeat protein [Bacteroidia bacterium]|nr:tetratricopeptide repeat protein [Bacteroidia bacterium]